MNHLTPTNLMKSLTTDINHMVGNALFAIETNLLPLQARIQRNDHLGSLEILCEIQASLEKAKEALHRWAEAQNESL